MAEDALKLKELGNGHFKAGRFKKAAQSYTAAERLDPNDPTYASNLSAALYELGQYEACVSCIIQVLRLLTKTQVEERNDTLIKRLCARLSRSLRYGFRSGRIPHQTTSNESSAIEVSLKDLEEIGSEAGNVDIAMACKEWELARADAAKTVEGSHDAQERLIRLPRFKLAADSALEYYTFSHDDPMSIIDYYAHDHPASPTPLRLESLSEERLSKLAFLLGGVGDARHVFGSVIGLNQAYVRLPKAKQASLKAHFTLLDIKSTALARDLCILILLNDLISDDCEAQDRLEIKATIFYIYTGVIVPQYCYARLMATVTRLRQNLSIIPPSLPPWIYVSSESIPAILLSLDHWLACSPTKDIDFMLHQHDADMGSYEASMARLRSQDQSPIYQGRLHRIRQSVRVMLDSQTDEDILGMESLMLQEEGVEKVYSAVPNEPSKRARFIREAKGRLVDHLKYQENSYLDSLPLMQEKLFYKESRAFVPPPDLWEQHETFVNLWKAYRELKPRMPGYKARRSVLEALKTKAHAETKKTWRPNPSLFDIFHESYLGYPGLSSSGFLSIQSIETFNVRSSLQRGFGHNIVPDSPSYSIVWNFFGAFLAAVRKLGHSLQIEIICGELNQEMLRMRTVGYQDRPTHFPRSYTRAWLSNVPDYTHGPLSTAMYIVPALEAEPISSAGANCYLNTPTWKDGEEFCHNYTLLRTYDVPRYLGCRVLQMAPNGGIINLSPMPLPRDLHDLASRPELTTWLMRMLLCILIPGTMDDPKGTASVRCPNNLVAFIELLIHLHFVGFPSHWLSDLLQEVLNNKVETDVAPYLGTLPIPVTEATRRVARRKIYLSPWLVEFETILAMSYEAIPFPLSTPEDFSMTFSDIGLFETTIKSESFNPMTSLPRWNPYTPVISLMFFEPGEYDRPAQLISRMADLLEGKIDTTKRKLHILTVVEKFSIKDGVVRWRMSKERIGRMRIEGWVMISYRSDAREFVSQPDSAQNWKEVDESLR